MPEGCQVLDLSSPIYHFHSQSMQGVLQPIPKVCSLFTQAWASTGLLTFPDLFTREITQAESYVTSDFFFFFVLPYQSTKWQDCKHNLAVAKISRDLRSCYLPI